jgi:hypothetical protein
MSRVRVFHYAFIQLSHSSYSNKTPHYSSTCCTLSGVLTIVKRMPSACSNVFPCVECVRPALNITLLRNSSRGIVLRGVDLSVGPELGIREGRFDFRQAVDSFLEGLDVVLCGRLEDLSECQLLHAL